MESMQDLHSCAPSTIRLERADLGLVLAIAESGGVTRAGSLLHLSQSALSRRLLDLEARVRAPLLRRAGRRMTPTALGEEICRRAVEVERSFVLSETTFRRGVTAERRKVRGADFCGLSVGGNVRSRGVVPEKRRRGERRNWGWSQGLVESRTEAGGRLSASTGNVGSWFGREGGQGPTGDLGGCFAKCHGSL